LTVGYKRSGRTRTSAPETIWVPKTKLGKMVLNGEIVSIEDVFAQGLKIQEPEIVDKLLPDLKDEVLSMNIVQKQTDAGEQTRFKVLVVVGNENGYVGVGSGKAKQIRAAIEKAKMYAKMSITPIRRGCGSWECACDKQHSFPFRTVGKCGSVKVELLPGPRGLGVVANDISSVILKIAGVKDCWSRSFGSTETTSSLALAVCDALKNTYRIVTPQDWVG